MRIVLIQTHVPEFRLEIFDELHRRTGGQFEVWSGSKYFTPTTGAPAESRVWHRSLRNRFLRLPNLGWQSGHWRAALGADFAVFELNPRVASTWLLLLARRLSGRKSVLWGHVYPRAGTAAQTKPIRFLMMVIAGGVNAYTFRDADMLRRNFSRWLRYFPSFYINVSPNAVMWAKDCRGGPCLQGRHRILFVARLIAEKKPGLLLAAFEMALPSLPETVVLDFIGTGPLLDGLRQEIGRRGLGHRVAIHGSLYGVESLRRFYDEALVAVSTGYVGLSATQAFGFGVPMIIAEGEKHSVEIELCRRGFNCDFFPSNDAGQLAQLLVEVSLRPPAWMGRPEQIASAVRARYTLDNMSRGFIGMFQPFLGFAATRAPERPFHVAIAWKGLPYYAARVIREARRRHPEFRFTIISSRDESPYRGIEEVVGGAVHWVDADQATSWEKLGQPPPDLFLITSWPHVAYQSLAMQAKRESDATIVSMVDNYLRYTPKQLAGFFYFRLFLRGLYGAMWVPGEYSARFMRYLGVPDKNIYRGLYAADNDLFYPPPASAARAGVLFVGQFIERKGLSPLMRAAERAAAAGAPLELRLIGDGPLVADLIERGLAVEPFLQPAELAENYRRSDALILPSRIDHWGVVVHEAALCGCLLLLTRQCGCAHELVVHGVNGYVMERSSAAEIGAAFEWRRRLTTEQVAAGRAVSVERARRISPERWADTFDEMVGRFGRGSGPGWGGGVVVEQNLPRAAP